MKLTLLFFHLLLMSVKANVINDFIFDYFYYKKASGVVGYSCSNLTDDILLIKHFNENGVFTVFNAWADVTGEHCAAKATYYKLGIFLDTRCRDAKSIRSIYLDATNRSFYGELHYWLLLGDDQTDILTYVDESAFGLSTDLVVAISTGLDDFHLYDVYNKFKQRHCEMNVTFYGHWSTQSRLNISLLQIKSARRSNLYGLRLKVLYFQSSYRPKNVSLEEYYQDRRDVTKDGRVKFGYNIILYLAEMYNFTIEYIESENWKNGDTLGPLVRRLMNSSVDLSGTSIIANSERSKYMKFLHQGFPFRTCFIFRNPQPTSMKVQEILRPFADSVWYLTGIFTIVCMTILAFALKFEHKSFDEVEAAYSFTITIGATCQQSTDIQMKRLSTRIIFLTIMLFSLLMYNYYSACVVSARLDEPIIKINDSLVELGKLNLKMASERMFFLNFFFASSLWETQMFKKNYWLKIPESQRFMEPELGMKLVQKGQFAYHVHADTGYAFIEKSYDNREVCELTQVHIANRLKTLFGVTSNSTIEELMKVGFLKISETGIRSLQLKRWQYREPRCRKDILNTASINIWEFAPHLLLLVLGMLVSIAVYVVEVFIFNYTRRIPSSCHSKSEMIIFIENIV